jgi:hypothetical protein
MCEKCRKMRPREFERQASPDKIDRPEAGKRARIRESAAVTRKGGMLSSGKRVGIRGLA